MEIQSGLQTTTAESSPEETKDSINVLLEDWVERAEVDMAKLEPIIKAMMEWGFERESDFSVLTEETLKEIFQNIKVSTRDIKRLSFAALKGSATSGHTLKSLIDSIYNARKEWKSLVEEPHKKSFESRLKWVGRKSEMDELQKSYSSNLEAYLRKDTSKHALLVPLIFGGLGVGKTRLVWHSLNQWKKDQHDQFKYWAIAFLDFSRGSGDELGGWDSSVDSIAIGFRLACLFFFGASCNQVLSDLSGKYGDPARFLGLFDLSAVFEEIKNRLGLSFEGDKLCFAVQIDEYQEVPQERLNGMMGAMANHMMHFQDRGIFLQLALSGTNPTVDQGISLSKLKSKNFLLGPLSKDEARETLKSTASNVSKLRAYVGKFDTLPFLEAVDALGNYGRNLEYFLQALEEVEFLVDELKLLSNVLKSTVQTLRDRYSTDVWKKFLGNTLTGPRNVCLWGITQKSVKLTDKINGVTVEEARNSGILYLLPHENQDEFLLDVPLVFLRALNFEVKAVEDEALDPFQYVGADTFEVLASRPRFVINNLLVDMNVPEATYEQLWPGAIGRQETLKKKVAILKLQDVTAAGKSSAHQSLHTYDSANVPIVGSTQLIDVRTGKFLVKNVEKAPSMDLYVHHPARQNCGEDSERIQAKSSEDIVGGNAPNTLLQLGTRKGNRKGTIWTEYNKISDHRHNQFGGNDFTFVLISNKPLEKYEEVVKDPARYLPPNTLVVCNQNFTKYCPSTLRFSSIYIPAEKKEVKEEIEESKEEIKKEAKNKKSKSPQKKRQKVH